MSAPERIWADVRTCTVYMDGSSPITARDCEFRNSTEYTRSDLVTKLAAENERLTRLNKGLHDEVQFMRKAAKENRERHQEPVAWRYRYNGRWHVCDSESFARSGWDVTPLFTRHSEQAMTEVGRGLLRIVEEIDGAVNHGTWRDKSGMRLKDTPEWVAFYNAIKAAMEAGR